VVQPPPANRADIVAVIDRFQLQRGTATGSGVIVSLATLFPDAGIDVSALIYGHGGGPRLLKDPAQAEHKPVPPGSYRGGTIILLSDGQRTTGPDPDEAAQLAAERGVRVYTVGFGTQEGAVIGFEGWSFRARLDEDSLKSIARITHGEYFYAGTAEDLKKVYQTLNTRLVLERKDIEVTALFAAAAAGLALVSAVLSLVWFNRIL
jgi:Ca-activated chloride channel family protein